MAIREEHQWSKMYLKATGFERLWKYLLSWPKIPKATEKPKAEIIYIEECYLTDEPP
jgi:hypothetical protein